ncbi:MAG: hypothetical protein L0Z70_04495 [Chloroflexi bacterium]|nr:hypothetical protein [Chloroflexota bacterium]
MPIIEVEIVLRSGESWAPGQTRALAERLGEAMAAPPGSTWVKTTFLRAEDYAESGGGPPEGVAPVFISVLRARLPSPAEMGQEAAQLAAAAAEVCKRPQENVHILYLPEAAGRMFFGGRQAAG